MNRRGSRILVIAFIGTLVGFCLFFTFGLSPYLKGAAERSDAFNLLGKCLEVAAGDRLLVEQRGEERWVRLIGIEAPVMEEGPELYAQAERVGRDPEWLLKQGRVTRNTLSAWVYRRGLHIIYPWGEDARDDDGNVWVYAEVAGVDLSRKLLQGGQVYALDVDHPRRDLYAAMEAEAREKQTGIWQARPRQASLF